MKISVKKIVTCLLAIGCLLFVPTIAAKADVNWYEVEGVEGGKVQFNTSTATITDCETTVT